MPDVTCSRRHGKQYKVIASEYRHTPSLRGAPATWQSQETCGNNLVTLLGLLCRCKVAPSRNDNFVTSLFHNNFSLISIMLVKDLLALGAVELENFSSKQLESRILLADVLNLTTDSILLYYNQEVSEHEKARYLKYIQRRKLFEPIAYIVGKKEFYSINFFINEHVLIPRPETEMLVDAVITESSREEIRILDLGTGSGAIAVSLAANLPLAEIGATDISDQALEVATKNARANNVANRIKFIKSDWFKNLSMLDEKFDFIVSNPPYISVDDKSYMTEETLKYEPVGALFANNNGLAAYESIIANAGNFLKKEGKIFLEIGFNQAEAVMSILREYSFREIKLLKDLSEHDRVLVAVCHS